MGDVFLFLLVDAHRLGSKGGYSLEFKQHLVKTRTEICHSSKCDISLLTTVQLVPPQKNDSCSNVETANVEIIRKQSWSASEAQTAWWVLQNPLEH